MKSAAARRPIDGNFRTWSDGHCVHLLLRLTGGTVPRTMTVNGIGFVPDGPHNSYDQGAWLTPAGFNQLFGGAHYKFKFHLAALSLRPGATAPIGSS